ncbi:MAG: phage terminase small subunit P27 family [Steroidobacteraceae bacterium]
MPNYKKTERRKKLAGTLRADRTKRRPKARGMSTIPAPPEHLTARARAEWLYFAPSLAALRTVAAADLRGLEMLCETLATAQQAQAVIASAGLTIGSARSGKIRAHPAIKIMETARAQATRLLIEFGLTPRARSHVEPAADTTPDNAFARL